jgi:hypothetical protein
MWIVLWLNPQWIQVQCPVDGSIYGPFHITWYRMYRAGRMTGAICGHYFLSPAV